MVRLMVTDALPFQSALRAGVEVGPTGNLSMRARTVAYYYSRPRPALGPPAARGPRAAGRGDDVNAL